MADSKRCCICGKKIVGFGNNPHGARGADGSAVKWKKNQVCCDECNAKEVIPGRLADILEGRH